MSDDELGFLPVAQLAALMQGKQLSPVELVEACLRRIERLDKRLGSFITVAADQALDAARKAEAAMAAGRSSGPLHGIPFGIKDQIDAKGLPTTRGFRPAPDVAEEDATVVAHLKAAGAVLVGKHVLTGNAAGGPDGLPFGLPRNPWDPRRHPGGSSNGSAVAVAAGLIPMAIGEDTGGSIRVPAAFNGITGLRPTWGQTPLHGVAPIVGSMDTVGPLARTAEDCALILRAITPNGYSTARLGSPLAGIRIGLVHEYLSDLALDPEVREATLEAARVLEALGANLSEVTLPLLDVAPVISTVLNDTAMAGRYRDSLDRSPAAHSAGFRWRLNAAALLPAAVAYKVAQGRVLVRRQLLAAFSDFDILLSPCTPKPAPLISETPPAELSSIEDAHGFLYKDYPYTSAYSLAGLPAISVPCGLTHSGLPIGLQLAAAPLGEATLLQVAHGYQKETDWGLRRPSLAWIDRAPHV